MRQVVFEASLKQAKSVVRTPTNGVWEVGGNIGAHTVPQTLSKQGILRSQEEIGDRKSLGLVSNLFRDR